jgi:hypothetical protein
MGVDYSGNYGIGIQVYTPDFEEGDDYYEDELGYIESILKSTNYSYFETGEGSYSGDIDDIYIIIDNPFEDGYCALGEKADKLIEFLQENNMRFEGKVDVVGGLRIW